MIRYFQLENHALKPGKENDFEKVVWCDLLSPTDDELMLISQKCNINIDDLEDCLDESERPRYNFDFLLKNHLLILRVISSDKNHADQIDQSATAPFGFIYTANNKLITVHANVPFNFDQVNGLLAKQNVESGIFILLEMLHLFSVQMETMAQKIANKVRGMQKEMLGSHNASDIQRVFDLNSHLILFNTEILSNMNSVKTFYTKNKSLFENNILLLDKYDEIQTDFEQIYAFSSIYRDIMANSLDAYASVINNNVTAVMKIVGSLQLILSIPMLVASIWGMNVYIPGTIEQGSYTAAAIIFSVTFVITMLMWRIFKRKQWL